MDEIKEIVEEVGKDVAICMGTIIKNYIGAIINHSLKPTLQNALQDMVDDAKDQLGKGSTELKDNLPFEAKGVLEPGQFLLELQSCPTISVGWNQYYVSYKNIAVRVDKKPKSLVCLCRPYQIRWSQYYRLNEKLIKENKDAKLAPLPEEYLLGTYCCCLTREWNPGHYDAMRTWVNSLKDSVPESKVLPDHFYMGENYENQQMQKNVFDEAFALSRWQLCPPGRYSWNVELEPFDEGEAIMLILKSRTKQFVDKALTKVPDVPGKWKLEWTAASTINEAVQAGFTTAWDAAQKPITEVKDSIQKAIQDAGEGLVNALKPILQKVVDLIKSKMEGGDEKDEKAEEKKEEKAPALGDVLSNWKLEATELGGQVDQKLGDQKEAPNAMPYLAENWTKAVEDVFSQKIGAAVEGAVGGKMAKMAIFKTIVKGLAKYITGVIKNFTTISQLVTACKPFLDIRNKLEEDLVANKDKKDEMEALIATASSNMWKTLPRAALELYKGIEKVKDEVKRENGELCSESLEALIGAADILFEVQIKAVNALRVMFTETLRADIAAAGQENEIRAAVRGAFRKNFFILANAVVKEGWTKVAAAMIEVARQEVLNVFRNDIMPGIAEGLTALGSLPAPLDQLDIVSLAATVADTLLTKLVVGGVTKVFISLEKSLFTQGAPAAQ